VTDTANIPGIMKLARPEIVAMKPYSSARKEAAAEGVLLNANESPRSLVDCAPGEAQLNRYPDPQPGRLLRGLADLYGLPEDHVLVTRGSDEGIDLLTRVFCRAGQDAILQCPPTFGMYRICAQTQGAAVVSIPRDSANDFAMDGEELLRAVSEDPRIRLVFLTSPNNPTGDCVDTDFLLKLMDATHDTAVVVVDEAYAEFCDQPSATELLHSHPNLVVLRTLSKAWASAGLRCGTVLAQPPVIDLLRRIIAPYPLASPVAALAERVLKPDMQVRQKALIAEIRENKGTLLTLLSGRALIKDLWPGEANFVLIRTDDAAALLSHCARRGVILRGYPNEPELANCIRISVGSKQDLAALEQTLDAWEEERP